MFEFLKGKSDDNTSENMALPGADAGAPASTPLNVGTSSSSATVNAAASGRRKKRGNAGETAFTLEDGSGAKPALSLEQQQQLKMLEDLFNPKVWKSAVGAPGDAMVMATGKEYWKISEDEKETLAITGAATARAFAVTDPRWLALSLFGFSILTVYGSRALKHLQEKRAEMRNDQPKPENLTVVK